MAGFQVQYTTTTPSESVTLPLVIGQTYNCQAAWDGEAPVSITAWDDANATHVQATPGTYMVEITGQCDGWSVNSTHSSKLQWTSIVYWGDTVDFDGFSYLTGAFFGCTNITSLGSGKILTKAGMTTADNMFRGCTGLTGSIPVGLFDNCTNFTRFYGIFYQCYSLSGELEAGMFRNHTSATTFAFCFGLCNALKLNPWAFYNDGEQSTRFLNQSVDFQYCFWKSSYSGGSQGQSPDVWSCNYGSGTPTTANCYLGAGNSLASLINYNNIPAAWGGSGYVDTPPEITAVDLTDVGNGSEIDVTGTDFETSGGTMYACDTNVLSDTTKVSQTVDTQSDTSLGVTISGLSGVTGVRYLYFVDSDSQITDSPWSINYVAPPITISISDSTLTNGQAGVVLSGTDFMDSGAILELCNNSVYASATIKLTQTITNQTDSALTFTVNNNNQIFGNKYLFVTTSLGQRNATPYTVNIGRTVYFFVTNNGGDRNATGFPVTLFE